MLSVEIVRTTVRAFCGRIDRWLEAGEPVPHDNGGFWWQAQYGDGPTCAAGCPLAAAARALEYAGEE